MTRPNYKHSFIANGIQLDNEIFRQLKLNHLYYDNSIIRRMTDNHDEYKKIENNTIQIFGTTITHVTSPYLFLEYIGFTKKNLQIHQADCDLDDVLTLLSKERGSPNINLLDELLCKIFKNSYEFIKAKLLSSELKIIIQKLIYARLIRVNKNIQCQEFNDDLFGYFFNIFNTNYEEFAELIAIYLAWDEFCSIQQKGIPPTKLRWLKERQLAYWYQNCRYNYILPFGKIIHDQDYYYKMEKPFKSRFKNCEDMVDSEAITLAVIGYKADDGDLHPVNFITFDSSKSLQDRLTLALGSIHNMETTLNQVFNKFPGTIYRLDSVTLEYKERRIPIIPIQLKAC